MKRIRTAFYLEEVNRWGIIAVYVEDPDPMNPFREAGTAITSVEIARSFQLKNVKA